MASSSTADRRNWRGQGSGGGSVLGPTHRASHWFIGAHSDQIDTIRCAALGVCIQRATGKLFPAVKPFIRNSSTRG